MKTWSKFKVPLLALLALTLASYVVFLEVEANNESDELIGASAVWQPQEDQLAHIQNICAPKASEYGHCFLEQMGALDAPDDAVAFTQSYAGQHNGVITFLNGFRPIDAVDLGYAFFPAGADFNERWFLLNGTPAIIDVDDLGQLPQAVMVKDPAYRALQRRYPHLALFDGDRGIDAAPASSTLAGGGQRFIIDYPLKDQCRACAVAGQASFSFDFDAAGRLLGVKFLKVTPAIAKRPTAQ